MPERKTDRREFRLGLGGDFEPHTAHNAPSVNDGRARFLSAATIVEPKVWRDLSEPLKVLYRLLPKRKAVHNLWPARETEAALSMLAEARPGSLKAFERSLDEWGKRFNLTDSWCIAWARNNVILMYKFGPNTRPLSQISDPWTGITPIQTKPFLLDTWEPEFQTLSDYKKSSRQHFDKALKAYCDALEEKVRSAGYVLTPARRQSKHFRWLAGYQVCCFSIEAIARALGKKHPGGVRYAIHGLARDIDLSLRPATKNRRVSKEAILAAIQRRGFAP
jgi:hypothetical protein